MKKVRDFMTKKVIYFHPDQSIFEVAKIFSEKNISGGPVVEKGKVVGIISTSDIVKHLSLKLRIHTQRMPSLTLYLLELLRTCKDYLDLRREMKKISNLKVRNVMKKKVISINPSASIFDAAALMNKHDVTRLPVIEKGKLVGIIARDDIIKALL
ncbi:MAG: CBS domain-containing protein [Candidatus Aenigmatarchaeota archaeon]